MDILLVRFASISPSAIAANLHLGRHPKVRFVEIFLGNVQTGELGERGRRAQTARSNVGDAVVGYEMLGDAVDG